jgi:hypothetical protein
MLAAVAADGDDPSARYGSKHAMAACAALDTSAVFRQMPRRDVIPVATDQPGTAGGQWVDWPAGRVITDCKLSKNTKRRRYEVRSGLSHHRTISHVPITKLESEKAMKVTCGSLVPARTRMKSVTAIAASFWARKETSGIFSGINT